MEIIIRFFDNIWQCYQWQGVALGVLILVMLCVEIYYFVGLYGRVPSFRVTDRPLLRDEKPAISVIVPLFSESRIFIEEQLPLMLNQDYERMEVVVVYVGSDKDFYEDLLQTKEWSRKVVITKIEQSSRYPVSTKTALNVGIKSAHYDFLVLTSSEVVPASNSWISLMATGFERGDVVIGYCGIRPRKTLSVSLMRLDRMMSSVVWMSRAMRGKAYRGIRHNLGLTKKLYFDAKGFNYLNMNSGEDDLFLQKIIADSTPVSVVVSPKASVMQYVWGGGKWWSRMRCAFGYTFAHYPLPVKNYIQAEPVARVLFFGLCATAIAVMPWEFKIYAAAMLLLRYVVVLLEVRRLAVRLGEKGLLMPYVLYDMFEPWYDVVIAVRVKCRRDWVWK